MKAMIAFTILITCGIVQAQLGRAGHPQPAVLASDAAATAALNRAEPDPPRESVTSNVDSDHSITRFYIGSNADPEAFNVAVARVSGAISFDRAQPARSEVNLVVYPSEAGGPAGPDGRLANGRPTASAAETVLLFRSTGTAASNRGELRIAGELTVRHIRRDPVVVWNEAYDGPTYGEPAVSSLTRPATLVVAGSDTRSRGRFPMTASLQVGNDSFPGLTSAILHSDWPIVVENEACVNPETFEDYDGPSCTGTTVSAEPQVIVPAGVSEDYYGMGQVLPYGSRVTVTFHLTAIPAGGSSQSGGK